MSIDFTMDRTITVPAGTYYLCDPCYAINDEEWDNILESSGMLTRVYAEHERGVICAFSTSYGDGTYPGSDGHDYDVDAGLIGLVDARYWKGEEQPYSSTFVILTTPTECSSRERGAVLRFGDITINTDS